MSRTEPSFAERLQTAAKAKQVQLEKIRATAQVNAPLSAERQAALLETEKARQIRTAERKAVNRIAAERKAEERTAEKARQAQAASEALARKEAELAGKLQAEAALQKEQKASRDSKYAARKARQK
jgi:hypothetical protein